MNKLNKRAAKLLSIWWFFVIFVAAGGIVLGVVLVQTRPVDVRALEADILSERLIDCFINQGYLNDFKTLDVYSNCGLEKTMFEGKSNYYFRIQIYNETGKLLEPVFVGGANYQAECDITTKVKGQYYPECINKTEMAIYNGKMYKLNILTASNQEGIKNVL